MPQFDHNLPLIETNTVEVPFPPHLLAIRGVGEIPLVPPAAAVVAALTAQSGEDR